MVADKEIEKSAKKRGCFLLLGPPITLLFVAKTLTSATLTDLIVYRTCLVSLNINASECLALHQNAGSPAAVDLEVKIEPYASMIVMTKSLIEDVLPAVLALFLGSWSDRNGRRPLFLLVFSGWTLRLFILSIMCDSNISPWLLLLALIPTSIVGGTATVRLAAVCYISDTTAEKDRMLQLSLVQVSICGGIVLGGFVQPSIYENFGYTYVFGIAAICCGTALVWTYLCIPETVKDSVKESIRGIFRISFIKTLLTSALMKRGRFHRPIIWLAIFTLTLSNMIRQGDIGTTEFLFTRARLGWDVQHYSYLSATDSALRIIGLCGVILRSRISGATDTLMGIIGLISGLGAAITKFLTWKDWHMYLSVCIGFFNEITMPAMKSIISKFVPAHDIGKVFSLITLLEVLSSSAGTSLYTLIYTHYLPPIYPSPVHMISISICMLSIILVMCIEVLIRKSSEPTTHVATVQAKL